MAQDIEMKAADDKEKKVEAKKDDKKEDKVEVQPKPMTVKEEIKLNLALLDRAVHAIEPRYSARVLRTLTTLRRRLDKESLSEVIETCYPKSSSSRKSLLSIVSHIRSKSQLPKDSTTQAVDGMDVDEAPSDPSAPPAPSVPSAPVVKETPTKKTAAEKEKDVTDILPESDVYLRLLVVLGLIDAEQSEKAYDLAFDSIKLIQSLNRRSMDHLAAKTYFYLARSAELAGGEKKDGIRPILLAAHSTASLRHDEDLQGTLINLLLRNYFQANLYDQADKLLSKTTFPESCGNAQLARYLFYLGRIRAVQLNYTESHSHLQHAIRRAPSATVAPGFHQTVHKFFVVVELLMGDIPERSIFRQPVLRKALVPYFQLVQAVRIGDLDAFQKALTTYTTRFISDGTHSLILRLRHNVIKTALRMISIAYSRISLKDICLKLHLDSEEDTEYIVAKAIRDGVIDAEVDHQGGFMKSKEAGNIYETDEPQKAFQQRIDFCINLHNDSVKAMRYPLNAQKQEPEDSELLRERMLDIESALAEAAEDDDGMDGF